MKPSFFVQIQSWLVDAFFPIQCLGCGREGEFLCEVCLERIPEREFQECPICRKPFARNGAVCVRCRRTTALDGLFVSAPYKFPLLEQALHTFKYRYIEGMSLPLSLLLERALVHSTLELPDLIIPVPLHSRRLRFRGFNQSELLAQNLVKRIAPLLELPVKDDLLLRVRFTKPQMKTRSAEERRENLKEAFCIPPDKAWSVAGRYIWLLDDVATTGTTLDECAKVLKQNGARKVWGVVIAR